MRPPTLTLLALGALLALLLAACGGNGNGLDTDYPSAGEDRFENTRATVEIQVTLPGVAALPFVGGTETVILEGPMVVNRSDPQDTDGDGLVEIETEITELTLTGTSSFGPIEVRQSPTRRSMGEVEQQEPGQDTPANSFFNIFLEVEILQVGLVGFNEEAIRMEAELIEFPPGFLDQYEGALALPTPLLSVGSEEEFALILDALHVPNPPPEDGEPPEEGETPETTVTEEPEPEAQEITEEQLSAIASAFIEQFPLSGYELDENRTGVQSNDDWIAEALNLKDAPQFLEQHGRTTGHRTEYFSLSNPIYQVRINVSIYETPDGARGYLDGWPPFLEGGIGTSSAHEGTLQMVEPFTPGGMLGDLSIGVTLGYSDQGTSYYQTYVGFTEGSLRTSVSLFTTPPPGDDVRNQAEELLIILRPIIVNALEE